MKSALVVAFEEMDLAIKNEDFQRASKYIIVQIEIIVAYLITDFQLVDDIINDSKLHSIYKVKGSKERGYYLSTDDKIRLSISYCNANDVNMDIIGVVKSVRDLYSHGYHHSEVKQRLKLAGKISNDHTKYFKECFKLIRAIRIKLYAQFQPLAALKSPAPEPPAPEPPAPEPPAPQPPAPQPPAPQPPAPQPPAPQPPAPRKSQNYLSAKVNKGKRKKK